MLVGVLVAGISQGLTLPLLSLILEKQGTSVLVNGLNAAALYIGAILIVLFAVPLLRRFGYKTLILGGLVTVLASTFGFVVFSDPLWWIVLRFLVGMGDSLLHYTTQTWLTEMTPENQRGRIISMYGMMYGLGFGIGPLGINLLPFGQWVPFVVMGAALAMTGTLFMPLRNEKPAVLPGERNRIRSFKLYTMIWFPVLAPLLFGFMEAALNVNFPIYAVKRGISEAWISILLPAFVLGSLFFEVPIGILSDRIGPKIILRLCSLGGALAFLCIPLFGESKFALLILLVIGGIFVGSFFALGLVYMAEILPRALLPAGNMLASIHYDAGSLIGPGLSGAGMELFSNQALFYMLGGALVLFAGAELLFRRKQVVDEVEMQE